MSKIGKFGVFCHLMVGLSGISLLPAAGFCSNTAIVLVDMQPGFLDEGSRPVPHEIKDPLIQSQLSLFKWAKAQGHSALVFEYEGKGTTISPLKEAAESLDMVAFIKKSKDDGFAGAIDVNPEILLRTWRVQNLILAGIHGAYCVRETARGALRRGFRVFTASDIVATFNQNPTYPENNWWLEDENFKALASLESLLSADFDLSLSLYPSTQEISIPAGAGSGL